MADEKRAPDPSFPVKCVPPPAPPKAVTRGSGAATKGNTHNKSD